MTDKTPEERAWEDYPVDSSIAAASRLAFARGYREGQANPTDEAAIAHVLAKPGSAADAVRARVLREAMEGMVCSADRNFVRGLIPESER